MWSVCGILSLTCIAGSWYTALHTRSRLVPSTYTASVMPAVQSPLWTLVHDTLVSTITLMPSALLPVVSGTAEVAAWSPNGQFLAVGDASGSLRLWDPARRLLTVSIWQAHARFLNALTWSPDGHLLVSAAADGSVRLWQVGPRGDLVPFWTLHVGTHLPHVPAVAFSANGILAIADGEHTVSLWRMPARPRVHGQPVPPRLQGRLSTQGHNMALMWSPNGVCLVAGTLEGQILVWQSPNTSPRPITRTLGSPVYALAWTPSGDTVAAGGADGTVRLLAAKDLNPRALLPAPLHPTRVLHVPDYGHTAAKPQLLGGAAINSMAWSPSGDILAVTATGTPLRLWQPARGAVIAAYQDTWDLNTVAWGADGSMLAAAADDGRVRILSVAEPGSQVQQPLCHLDGGPWCAPLLGQETGSRALPMSPPAYMSR